MRKIYLVAAASVASIGSSNLVHAALITNDTFPGSQGGSSTTYNDGTGLPNGGVALFGQTPTATGFSSAGWTSGAGSTSNLITDAGTNGYTGQVDWLGVSDQATRSNARNLATAQGGNPYVYYTATELVRNNDSTSASVAHDFIGLGYANLTVPVYGTTSGNQTGFYIGFSQTSATDPGSLVIRTRVTTATADSDVVMVNADPSSAGYVGSSIAGNEYLVITKAETNVVGGNQDRITYWINPTNLTSESAMTTSAQYTDASSPLLTYALQGTTSDLQRDEFAAIGFAPTVTFQQTALSTDLSSLAAAVESPTPAPEPASLSLVGIAALSTLSRRRRNI